MKTKIVNCDDHLSVTDRWIARWRFLVICQRRVRWSGSCPTCWKIRPEIRLTSKISSWRTGSSSTLHWSCAASCSSGTLLFIHFFFLAVPRTCPAIIVLQGTKRRSNRFSIKEADEVGTDWLNGPKLGSLIHYVGRPKDEILRN